MKQVEIANVGNALIEKAINVPNLQAFYDNLNIHADWLGGDNTMPLGWISHDIAAIAAARGILLHGFGNFKTVSDARHFWRGRKMNTDIAQRFVDECLADDRKGKSRIKHEILCAKIKFRNWRGAILAERSLL